MSVELYEQNGGKILEVRAVGTLHKADYEYFCPEVERLIGQFGTIRILFQMHDFHGWDMGALWADLKFDLKHFADIDRVAIVGETKWQEAMSKFCQPFTTARIRYFPSDQLEEARAWLAEE